MSTCTFSFVSVCRSHMCVCSVHVCMLMLASTFVCFLRNFMACLLHKKLQYNIMAISYQLHSYSAQSHKAVELTPCWNLVYNLKWVVHGFWWIYTRQLSLNEYHQMVIACGQKMGWMCMDHNPFEYPCENNVSTLWSTQLLHIYEVSFSYRIVNQHQNMIPLLEYMCWWLFYKSI